MSKLITAAIITTLLIAALCITPAAAITGTGTQADPYKLYTQDDLALLSGSNYASYAGSNTYFELANNIQMTGTYEPIGTSMYKFNGKFDGKGFTITGLTINNPSTNGQALFSYVTAGALIQNIVFDGASVEGFGGSAVLAGGVSALSSLPAIIDNVIVKNSIVEGNSNAVGGIVGRGSGSHGTGYIRNCQVIKSTIKSSTSHVGAIAGYASDSSYIYISNCFVDSCQLYSSGGNIGSIVGYGAYYDNAAMFLTDCHARNCIMQTNGDSAGCIAGLGADGKGVHAEFARCVAENCYVQGRGYIGGIAGFGTCNLNATCQFTDCSVDKCTIRATSNFAGGIYGSYRSNGAQPIVSGCTVTDTSILASNSAGGVTGGYSAS